jgi:hypothetical protein
MNWHHLLFFGVAGVLASGCSVKVASPPAGVAGVAPLAESPKQTTPLPDRTPFDGNPKARAAYLEYYALGYQLAITSTEYASPGCLCTADGDPERYEATVSGFFAGQDAVAAASARKQQENLKAPVAPSAPPPRSSADRSNASTVPSPAR